MKPTFNQETINAGLAKAMSMPIGTYSRLRVNNEVTDTVINPSSSGVYFYNVQGIIDEKIFDQDYLFVKYN
jgi:hypothetical protein